LEGQFGVNWVTEEGKGAMNRAQVLRGYKPNKGKKWEKVTKRNNAEELSIAN